MFETIKHAILSGNIIVFVKTVMIVASVCFVIETLRRFKCDVNNFIDFLIDILILITYFLFHDIPEWIKSKIDKQP